MSPGDHQRCHGFAFVGCGADDQMTEDAVEFRPCRTDAGPLQVFTKGERDAVASGTVNRALLDCDDTPAPTLVVPDDQAASARGRREDKGGLVPKANAGLTDYRRGGTAAGESGGGRDRGGVAATPPCRRSGPSTDRCNRLHPPQTLVWRQCMGTRPRRRRRPRDPCQRTAPLPARPSPRHSPARPVSRPPVWPFPLRFPRPSRSAWRAPQRGRRRRC